jgi:two-component system, NtrC family, response regulator AtoC
MSPPRPTAQPTRLSFGAATIHPDGELAAAGASPCMLVLAGETSRTVPLPEEGSMRVGRSASCEIQIGEASVSRLHARLEVADGEVTLVDLDSTSGTLVNGERLAGGRILLTGDLVSIGSATLVFHGGRRAAPAINLLDFPRLRGRLQEEVDRASDYARPFAVACADLGGPVDRRRLLAALVGVLRRIDAVAWAGDSQVFFVLPEVDRDDAAAAAAALVDALSPLADAPRVGHAVCPHDGSEVDLLLGAARHAALTARAGQAAGAGVRPRTVEIGPHAMLLADPAMIRLHALIERLAPVQLPVLITGETGTGKELAARALHERSPRRAARFAAVNCAALPEALFESELFGHERGAFSGAVTARAGILEDASGGTVFLDEIGEMPLAAQAKILRALETRQITRLGEVRERPIDIRLIAATNRDLAAEIRAGRFRADLYFRLDGASIRIPPLRERPAEIALLAQLFLDQAGDASGRSRMRLSADALSALVGHRWPGNVRELKNLMDYLAATGEEPVIDASQLAERLPGTAACPPVPPRRAPHSFRPLADELRELERDRIREALAVAEGNQTRAAALLRVPLRTFYDKVKMLGLTPRRLERAR